MKHLACRTALAAFATLFLSQVATAQRIKLDLRKGDRVVFMGGTFAEREGQFGYIETLLQARFPDLQLTFRNLGYSADTAHSLLGDITKGDGDANRQSNRALNFGTMHKHLGDVKADVIFLCLGMADSFAGQEGLEQFNKDLRALLKAYGSKKYNGKSNPRIVLVGPIAHEKLGGEFPDPTEHNKQLKTYNEAMRKTAAASGLPFVDLFQANGKLTFNGIHLTQHGYSVIAPLFLEQLGFTLPDLAKKHLADVAEGLRLAIVERNQQFFYRWRAVNGEYVYGRRAAPFGVVNFPGEMKKLDETCRELDGKILTLNRLPEAAGKKRELPALPSVAETYHQKQGYMPNGQYFPDAFDPEVERKSFKLPEGYEINLWASEKDFPLHNPLAMAWDTKGRLWVTTMPSYPHVLPGVTPNDKVLILEDTKGRGKADKCTVFADRLYLPTAIEFGQGGVYIGQQPNLMFARDTKGDDVADERHIILQSFGSGDSHHAIHMFHWSPEGALHFQEGIFHRTNVETPWGVVRQHDAGVYRFEPKSHKLDVYVSYNFANPWGHVFDRWGQNFIADASGGANYFALPLTGHVEYPRQHEPMKVFTSVVRPTCGCEIVSSRHFPPEAQGNFLVNNNIGFQGIKQHKVIELGSGFTSKELEPLLFSTDRNFRPVDLKFGPDGALYVVDWFNPLIGHMQHSIRDPGRNHYHGRIWRITYKGRQLVKAPKIYGEPIPELLDLLKTYEDRTRYRVRMELRERKRIDVLRALIKWVADMDPKDMDEHALLEALWVAQSHDFIHGRASFDSLHKPGPQAGVPQDEQLFALIGRSLLKKLIRANDYHARAAATRALRHWRDRVEDPLGLLKTQVNDDHPRVRLEAVIALSYFKEARAAEVALEALKHPRDYYLDYGLKETMATLEPYWRAAVAAGRPFAADNPAGAEYVLGNVSTAELVKMARSGPVYRALLSREGVLPEQRREALAGLAKLHKSDELTELFAAIERLDTHEGQQHGAHVLTDLAQLLTERKADDLARARPRLEQLATKARQPVTRQVAYVMLMTADHSADQTWKLGSRSADTLRDLVEAVPLIPDAKLRASTYPLVKPLLRGLPESLAAQVKDHKGVRGRFVRIELPGKRRTLTLAEVQVFSDGVNIARGGKASQSSVGYGGVPERAIDGNTSGAYGDGGQTHTRENETNPWWELDLGSSRPIDAVVIWNRSENNGEYAGRLDGFKLSILDGHRHPVFVKANNRAPAVNVRFTLNSDPTGAVRRAAVSALASLPGHETEAFTTLAKMARDEAELRDAAVRAIRRIPRSAWPRDQVRPLIDTLVAQVKKVPGADRDQPAVLDALQLGNDLASLLPPGEAKQVRGRLGELGVNVVLIRTVPHKMVYDRPRFYVEAGKPVVVVLENADIMPHNLVVCRPGALTDVGMAADVMGADPNAFKRQFVPNSPKVLHHTRLLQPQESERLRFVAPTTPGEYPYVCTFPGHWRVMYGTMHVVAKLSDVPIEDLQPPTTVAEGRPFVRNWTFADLSADLDKIDKARSFQRGKALFTAASCVQCHKMNKEGDGIVGPDLAEIGQKLADPAKKYTRADLLWDILEPSKVINEKYRTYIIVTGKGELMTGVIVAEDKKKLTVMTNPLAKPVEIPADDIDSKEPAKVSMMPQGLLVTLDREEILDLLAYVAAAGDPGAPAFARKE
jgi:putative heme-binding domain-containing protein